MSDNRIAEISNNDIISLLNNISKINGNKNETTLFDMVGNGSNETMHSAIICFLLDPFAHETGTECLKEFIKLLPEGSIGKFNPDDVTEIKTEKDLGPVLINENEPPTGGRADIYLEDAEGNVLIIENKIYAGDSECQLLRYHNSLNAAQKSHTLLYLTLKGNNPSDWSLGRGTNHVKTPLSGDAVNILSYNDIQQWLLKIKDYCSPSMKLNVEQYSRLLSNLLMENQIQEEILSSGKNYRVAIEIAKNLEDARMNLKREFLSFLKISLNELWKSEGNYLIEDYSNPRNTKLVGLTIYSKISGLHVADIVIDWRLYISCNRSFPTILAHDTWDYVGGKETYNFHDCSELIATYLSSQEDKMLIAGCASKQIMELIDRIERESNK
ncbi:MAG: PD-(D/E)XK nuclease family protein [Muribaculaceae bacterium]|nr:PD-(D/E)XK nuclease family protein [Muribaculaceae bacterium]